MGWRRVLEPVVDLANVIWPRMCEMCGKPLVEGERHLCLNCLLDLPRVNQHRDDFNVTHKRLVCRVPIERAASMFYYYSGSPGARLLQKVKYNSLPAIGEYLGEVYAGEIIGDGFFDGVDMLVPVPLHFIKRWRRGYNQSEEIAYGVSGVTGIEIADILRCKRHKSQTRKGMYARWINANNTYYTVNPERFRDKHVLLIDDIITTGATLVSCCEAIHAASPSTRISVMSIGLTHLR